jgi:hypothetical protein
MVLDVSATGEVTRLKLVKWPGHDLDAIAISEAALPSSLASLIRRDMPSAASSGFARSGQRSGGPLIQFTIAWRVPRVTVVTRW